MRSRVCETGFKILQLLKVLKERDVSVGEVTHFFDRPCAKGTAFNYFATLRSAGLCIKKRGDNYRLLNDLIQIDIDEEELKTLKNLKSFSQELIQPDYVKRLEDIFEKVEYMLSSRSYEIYEALQIPVKRPRYRKYARLIKKFSTYCVENKRIKIKYDGLKYTLDPISFYYENQNVFLLAVNVETNQRQIFLLNKINFVSQSSEDSLPEEFLQEIVFKVWGRLAANYTLREDEKIIDIGKDYKVIVNSKEDRRYLFNRLLKYGKSCEIVSPESEKKNFKEFVRQIIDSYSFEG